MFPRITNWLNHHISQRRDPCLQRQTHAIHISTRRILWYGWHIPRKVNTNHNRLVWKTIAHNIWACAPDLNSWAYICIHICNKLHHTREIFCVYVYGTVILHIFAYVVSYINSYAKDLWILIRSTYIVCVCSTCITTYFVKHKLFDFCSLVRK